MDSKYYCVVHCLTSVIDYERSSIVMFTLVELCYAIRNTRLIIRLFRLNSSSKLNLRLSNDLTILPAAKQFRGTKDYSYIRPRLPFLIKNVKHLHNFMHINTRITPKIKVLDRKILLKEKKFICNILALFTGYLTDIYQRTA